VLRQGLVGVGLHVVQSQLVLEPRGLFSQLVEKFLSLWQEGAY